MKIPSIDAFRQHPGTAYGPPFWADPEGGGFTVTIPEGDSMWEPHEPSYRMATDVLAQLDALTKKAVEFLGQIGDFGKMGMVGDPSYVSHVQVDARAEKVTISMVWDANINAEWSVTFSWREGHHPWPGEMAFRAR